LVAVKDPIASIGLRTVLEQAPGIDTLPAPDSLDDIRTLVGTDPPDVLLLDVGIRRSDPQLLGDLVDTHPGTRILVYVDHSPQDCALQHMLELGSRARLSPEALSKLDDCCLTSLRQRAQGCLGTGVPADVVVRSVRSVAAGEVAAAPWLASLAQTIHAPAGKAREQSPISVRELEVMTLLAEGLTNRQIAERLGIQEQTVKNHVTRTMEKLGVRNRTEVGLIAARHNLRLVDDDEGDDEVESAVAAG
jgi:DNA-binding NarL/FixJ family response regulator